MSLESCIEHDLKVFTDVLSMKPRDLRAKYHLGLSSYNILREETYKRFSLSEEGFIYSRLK